MEYAPIGAIASVRSGFAFKSKDWTDSGIPVVKIANVKNGFVNLDGCSFVSEPVARSAVEFELQPGDILISMTGYIGEVARVRNEGRMLLNQRVGRFSIRRPDAIDPYFLFCCLRNPELKEQFAAHAYGAAQPNISPSLIEQQEVPLPPLPVQRRIAGILSAYDDLIENSQRRIKILEEMARRLYREWFVHFRFPGHEDCRFVESPLGEIPEGWEMKRLGDVTSKIGSGATPKGGKGSYKSEGIHLIRSLNIYDYSFEIGNLAFIDDIQAAGLANVEVEEEDVLLNITGASVARCAMVPSHLLPARVNQHVAIVRADKTKVSPFYLLDAINSNFHKQQLLAFAQGGATREALTKDTISAFQISS